MSTELATTPLKPDETAICALVCNGDASKLNPVQRTQYYMMRCHAAGLDPRTQPFQFISLQGKLVLYALKTASEQLASKNCIRVEVLSQETTPDGIRVVTVRAIAKDGRQTDEIGCCTVKDLTGDALGNAYMKSMTKAKRRAILFLCGLGALDETEVETIPGAQVVPHSIPEKTVSGIKPPQKAPAKNVTPPPAAAPDVPLADDVGTPPEPGSNDGDTRDGIGITEIRFKEGKSAKGPWKCFFIHGNDGRCYTTFQESDAKIAQEAQEGGEVVFITPGAAKCGKDGKEYFPIMQISK